MAATESLASSRMIAEDQREIDALYQWMLRTIQHESRDEADAIEREIKPNARMSAMQRMEVYFDDYIARFRGILREDFSAVTHALGRPAMNELIDAYVRAEPSRHPNINFYGSTFPDFLRETKIDVPHRAFLVELAQLQGIITSKFLLHDDAALPADALQSVAPEQWENCVLTPRPSLSLHRFAYPVNAYLRAVDREEDVEIPEAESEARLQIFRDDKLKVWRVELNPTRFDLLSRLQSGTPLGIALMECVEASDMPADEFMSSMQSWFADWSSDGIFSALEVR